MLFNYDLIWGMCRDGNIIMIKMRFFINIKIVFRYKNIYNFKYMIIMLVQLFKCRYILIGMYVVWVVKVIWVRCYF